MDLSYASLFALFVAFVSLSLSVLFYDNKRTANVVIPLPPGKLGLPFLGESLEFLSTGRKGHPEKFILDRIAKYSSYIFKTHLFGAQTAVFCGANGNKFLFSNENKLVQVWWPNHITKIFPLSSSQTSLGEEALRARNMLPQFLNPESLQRYVGLMDHIAQKHFVEQWENNKEVMVFPLTKKYTFLLACKVFVSIEDQNRVDKLYEHFDTMCSGLFTIPINLPGTSFNKAIKASNYIREQLIRIIKQRKIDLAEGKASPKQDILSHMLLTSYEDGKFMHELEIANKILGLLVGGHDTASSACTVVVKYLAELPEIYEAVYKEQMEVARSKASGELLNWADLNKMKYSWNVACEALRLAPPLQGAFREAIADFAYNGFSIPKGWKLYWNANSTHMNPEFFPEPRKFDPSRFEGFGPAPYTFVPFGGGPRTCPGKEYARLEILVFMHHLVKRFKWEKIYPNEKIIVDPLPAPAKGLPVRLYPHKAY